MDLESLTELGPSKLAGKFVDGSPEWHQQRATGIGGSDVASVAQIEGAFKSRYVLWLEKAGLIPPETPNERTAELFEFGHRLEPVIAEAFADRMLDNYGVEEVAMTESGSWARVDHPWALANPDRLVLLDGELVGLEIKASGHGAGYEGGMPPQKYLAQCLWYAGNLGLGTFYLAALISLGSLQIWRLSIKETAVNVVNLTSGENEWFGMNYGHLFEEAKEFHASLLSGEAPPLDGGNDTYDYMRAKETTIRPKGTVDIPLELAQRLHQWDAVNKESEVELKRAKSETLELMGDAKDALVEGTKVAYRQMSGRAKAPSLYLAKGTKVRELMAADNKTS